MPRITVRMGRYSVVKEIPEESGCRACKFNEMGVCQKNGHEIPATYVVKNIVPKWCPNK